MAISTNEEAQECGKSKIHFLNRTVEEAVYALPHEDTRAHRSCFKGLKTHHLEEETYSAAL